jgi:3-oxoacyl-[acyl-carrier protein] reductase
MQLGLKGKKALVEGASTGLGYAIAKGLANEGVRVAIASSNLDRIEKAASEIGAAVHFQADLDEPGAGLALVERAASLLGGLDILITNTGGPKVAPFLEISSKDWKEGFQRLYMSATESIQAALPLMKKQKWGRIILLTSCSAKEPIASMAISSSIRSGLLGLMKSVSNEVAFDNITVNSVLPGFIKTERLSHLNLDEEKIVSLIPAKRLGKPGEVADLFVFLASDAASYITGQAIACDGGYLKSF